MTALSKVRMIHHMLRCSNVQNFKLQLYTGLSHIYQLNELPTGKLHPFII